MKNKEAKELIEDFMKGRSQINIYEGGWSIDRRIVSGGKAKVLEDGFDSLDTGRYTLATA